MLTLPIVLVLLLLVLVTVVVVLAYRGEINDTLTIKEDKQEQDGCWR